MISVVVVDDEHLVRSGFAALLASNPGIEVVGTADSGEGALSLDPPARIRGWLTGDE